MVESASELPIRVDMQETAERKKTEQSVGERENEYRELADLLPEIIFEADARGKLTFANLKAFEISGYTGEDFAKGMSVLEFLIPEDRDRAMEGFMKLLSGERRSFSEYTFLRKNGTTFPIILSSIPVTRGDQVLGIRGIAIDITESKKAEERIRESEEKFRTLFEEAMDAIFVADTETGILIDCNRAATELVGRTKSELIGKHQRILHPQQEATDEGPSKTFQQHLEEKEGQILETQVITKKGEIKEVTIKANLLELNGKKVLQGIFRDITEGKEAEDALRESEEKFRTIFENVNEVIVYADTHGKILDINERITETFGYRKDELVGKNFLRAGILRLKDIPKMAKTFKDALISGKVSSVMQLEVKHKNGNVVPVEVSARLLKKNENTEGFLALVRDITERKKAELALLESQEEFEGLFMRSPEAMAHTDARFEILDINPRFTELFGYSKEEAKGKNLDDLIVPSDRIEEAKELDKRSVKGYIYHDTVRKTSHGSLVPVSVSAAPIVVKGVLTGYVAVYKDISHLKKAEEALATMNEKLRVVGGLTRHDARNRLSLVTTYAYLAKECLGGNIEAKGYLGKIEGAVNDVVGIFDFAKIYEMLGVGKPTYVDVEKTVNEAVSLFPALETVKVTIDCHGLTVLADSLLRQTFCNLIDDSLKYAQNLTQIKVYYERMDNDHLRIVYEDNGVGISFDKKPMLFRRGYTSGKGSGYGLYLIQKMMEIYGWTIRETGEPGKGARFIMEMPRFNREGRELYCLNAKP